jgi:transcriptional regulator with XRE-family HTH domain
MRLGEVLRKERERKQVSVQELAAALDLRPEQYAALEDGEPLFEAWAPTLGLCAMALQVPVSRLISSTGKARDAGKERDQTGRLIRARREQLGVTAESLAGRMAISVAQLEEIERGENCLERYGVLLLRYAEIIEQPIFNFFYPGGIELDRLADYP